MLTWEYPPRTVGGIAKHCKGLSEALEKKGHKVRVVTLEFPGTPPYEVSGGLEVHRVSVEVGHPSFLSWVLFFNHFMEKKVADLARKEDFDIIHIHDWLVTLAGIAVKNFLNKPLVITMHSTEYGRAQGLHYPDSHTIYGVEWWGTYESRRVIVTTDAMKHEVLKLYSLPNEKVDIIPNAIDMYEFDLAVDPSRVKTSLNLNAEDRMVFFIGRLTPQKGVEYLIEAFPLISREHPDARLVITGDGWMLEELQEKAKRLKERDKIVFTRYVEDNLRIALLKSADVLVIPSIYEPFGIVALEGMAAGVPVVVSGVDGLKEVVTHDVDGMWVYPRDPRSIAWGVNRILSNREYAMRLLENARRTALEKFSWSRVAEKTLKSYELSLI